jgi:hypothetical protein
VGFCRGLSLFWAAFPALFSLLARPALADDQPFVTIYTTDIESKDERELEHWLSWKSGNANQSFNEARWQTEAEFGITDDFQGSIYLNYDWTRTRPHPAGATDIENAVGVQAEFIYRVLNVYFDGLGLAFYAEPAVNTNLRSFETKILVQKNFFNDLLRNALNINFENRWEHDPLGQWNRASALEFDLGSSYNITPELSAGLEFDNERGFDGLILGGSPHATTNSFYLGPTIQYLGRPFRITFGFQTQLPIASDPAHAGNVVDGYTATDEHFRMTLRVAHNF